MGSGNKKDYYATPEGGCVWDLVRWMNYNLGTVVAYCWRAGKKAEEQTNLEEMHLKDLLKARDHLDNEIERVRFLLKKEDV